MTRIILLIFLYFFAWVQGEDYTCIEDFCPVYLEKNECMSTSIACKVQNKTHSGEFYPGEVPCNCCNVCLQNLHEGDACTVGSPDVTPPMLVCGPGLYCMQKDGSSEFTCQKMQHTPCFREQIRFDQKKAAGKIGSFMQRPRCDGDGNFLSAKCNVGQSCFCVNKNGERIFGEAPYTVSNELTMKCECSRMVDSFKSIMQFEYPILMARCQEDGSFDPLQCMDGKCVCIEPDSGSPSSDITKINNFDYIRMPCFDRKMHFEYKYLHDCEEIQYDLTEELKVSQKQQFTILGLEMPKCQSDGWFEAVQKDKSTFFCVNKYNQKIEDFEAEQGTQEALDMNCKCARTRWLLKKYQFKDLPRCKSNGNFEKKQCRGDVCYCVTEDGLQQTKEVPNNSEFEC